MILRLMSLGIPVAGFFAAGVIAGHAAPARAPSEEPRAEAPEKNSTGHKVVKLHVVGEGSSEGSESGRTLVIDGEDIAGDVEAVVSGAITGALAALEEADEEIRIELNGEKLKAMSKEHREALAGARRKLEHFGEDLEERLAEVEIHVKKAAREAGAAAEKAGTALRERRVIVLRDGGGDAEIKLSDDDDGHTVIIVEGKKVKVIKRKKRDESEKADSRQE